MKNETLYNKTVDILVQAYFNDTLQHGTVCGCAVGNLVCANMYNGNRTEWSNSFRGNSKRWGDVIDYSYENPHLENYDGVAKQQIDSTGYSVFELAKIEKAFESANKRKKYDDKAMFKGLMNVVDTLDQIHENTDPLATEQTKRKFNKTLHPIK